MCKFNPKNDSRRIDPCMKKFISFVNNSGIAKTLACCCGHGKYPMTLVIRIKHDNRIWEVFSDKTIPRKRLFYKKDKKGIYYIPESLV